MKSGVNLWTVYGWDPEETVSAEVLRGLAGFGSQGVELVLDEGQNSAEILLAQKDRIHGQMADTGMEIPSIASALFWQYNLAAQDPALRAKGLDVIRKGCLVAQAFGARVFLVVAGLQEPGVEYQRTYATAVETLCQAAKEAQDLGVILGVENVPSNFICSPGEYAGLLRAVGHPAVQAYVDFGNGASIGPGYPENWIRAVSGQIAMVHAKDYDQGFRGFVCCGQGDLNWESVFSALKDAQYDDYLFVETPPKGGRGVPTRAAGLHAAQTSLNWLQNQLTTR